MNEVHRLPDVARVEEEASAWMVRLDAGDPTDDDRARFEAWRSAHPLHARTYEAMSVNWRRFETVGPWVRAVSFGQSMHEAAHARPRRGHYWGMGVAAALGGVAFLFATGRLQDTIYQTALGQHTAIALPDGSTLELNSGSRARVEYTAHARNIYLERGEGYFKVRHDSTRPFSVMGGNSWVQALGTAFNVDLRKDGLRVTVSEGAVKVSSATLLSGQASVVSAGQVGEVGEGATDVRRVPEKDVIRAVAWRSGTLNFERQSLGEVVEELQRYTALKLIVKGGDLSQREIGGTFEANPKGVEEFISMLQQGMGVDVTREPRSIVITPANIN